MQSGGLSLGRFYQVDNQLPMFSQWINRQYVWQHSSRHCSNVSPGQLRPFGGITLKLNQTMG